MGFGNYSSPNKTAFAYFSAQDILQHMADTYSINPRVALSQVQHIILQNPIDHNSNIFNFRPITFVETLAAFEKKILTSKGNSPDGIKLGHLSLLSHLLQQSPFHLFLSWSLEDITQYPPS